MGKATFGKVNLAVHEPTGQKVAVKVLEKSTCFTSLSLKESPKRYTYSNWFNTQISSNFMRLSKSPNTSSLSLSTVVEESCLTILQTKRISLKLIKIYLKRGLQIFISNHRWNRLSGPLGHFPQRLKPENMLLDTKTNIKIVYFGLSNIYA